MNLNIQGEIYWVFNIYGPNIDDPAFFEEIGNQLHDTNSKIIR